jgi:acetyl esterase
VVTKLDIDPRWAPHISGAQRVNEVLREMGDLIPPMDTPEQIAAMRVLPDAFRDLELALPMENRTIPGPVGPIRARVAVPPTVRAVYLDIHGGGFCMGWPEMKDATNARLALAADIAIVSIDYRLAPEHPYPAGPDDCYRAIDWLIDRAWEEFGTRTVFIGGDSAGGNLAALAALHARELGLIERVAGVNLTYGVFDLAGTPSSRNRTEDTLVLTPRATEKFHEAYVPGLGEQELRNPMISPLYADLSGLPPALLCVGTLDPLLDDSLLMAKAWKEAGNLAELYVVPASPHGFAGFPTPMAAELETLTAEWIGQRLAAHA